MTRLIDETRLAAAGWLGSRQDDVFSLKMDSVTVRMDRVTADDSIGATMARSRRRWARRRQVDVDRPRMA